MKIYFQCTSLLNSWWTQSILDSYKPDLFFNYFHKVTNFASQKISKSILEVYFITWSFHVKWTKFQKSFHLTLMDFAQILSSQYTHQEMKTLKILLSSRERFQNYSHLNYGPFNVEIESLQFVAFWKCSYLESFNSKYLKFWIVPHFLEVFTTKSLIS